MATSQKYRGYCVVPWYNTAEWQRVYTLIFSKNSTKDDQKTALDIIAIWQMRTPHLPSGVEGTLCIVEALLIEYGTLPERQYQILCASSIMRFLNICVAHRAQVHSFTRTARDNFIPDWLINIRHDFAHSQKLPSVPLLNLALNESFKWLKTTYWKPELEKMTDNIISSLTTTTPMSDACSLEIHELMGLYCNIFVYDSLSLCYNEFIQDKMELVDASSKIDEYPKAIIYLLEQGVEDLGDYDWNKCFDEIIHSHFYVVHPGTLIDKKGNSNSQYANLGDLFNLIEKHQKLPLLLRDLFSLCTDERETMDSRIGVAMWLDEIFKGMLKFRKKKSIRDSITGIHFKQVHKETVCAVRKLKQFVFITISEQLRKYFVNNYLALIDSKNVSSLMKELNRRIVAHPEADTEDSLNLQQQEVDYEQKMIKFMTSIENGDDTHQNGGDMDTEEPAVPASTNCSSCKRWNPVSDTSIFESCAIGVVPTQWTRV